MAQAPGFFQCPQCGVDVANRHEPGVEAASCPRCGYRPQPVAPIHQEGRRLGFIPRWRKATPRQTPSTGPKRSADREDKGL